MNKGETLNAINSVHIFVSIPCHLEMLSCSQIIFVFSLPLFLCTYILDRYIKMSSPYLNNTIIIGCLLTYTSVILLGLDSSLTSEAVLPMICTARIWILMAGFTLAFGSMFSKTWRVYSIFTNLKLNKKVIG